MYFCPSREILFNINGKRKYMKSNLSKKGKIYNRMPSLDWCKSIYAPDADNKDSYREYGIGCAPRSRLIKTREEDWGIEEI